MGRYRRGVHIPADWADKSVHLIMEGVFHESAILVDGVAVAVHGDGWTPIEIDLTRALAGKTSFVLGVDARVADDRNEAASANRPPQSRTGTASKAESGSQRVWRRGTRSTSPKLPCEHRLTSRRALCR
jgi:Glycosyl hydrolases family 2, sugar binding domain